MREKHLSPAQLIFKRGSTATALMKVGNEREAGKPVQSGGRSNKRAGAEPRPKGPAQV